MSLYHRARIIHNPVTCRYDVEVKRYWWSIWKYWTCYTYVTDELKRCSGTYQRDKATALRHAQEAVADVMANHVVLDTKEGK